MTGGPDRRRFLGGVLAATAAAALGPACSGDGSGPAVRPTAPRPRSPSLGAGLDDAGLADEQAIHSWIGQIAARGIRRPGYPADHDAEQQVLRQFHQFGLQDVHLEPVAVARWEPAAATLDAKDAGGGSRRLACFPVPYAVPTPGVEAELVPFDPADPSRVAGRAALVDARLVRIAPDALAAAGSAPPDPTGRVFDPAGTFAGAEQILPHTAERRRIFDAAIASGAVAVIGALVDHPGGGHEYFVPYDGEVRSVPGAWISGDDGAWLKERLATGPVTIRLVVDATTAPATSHNVVGSLPGADDDLVVVGSHHDGPWASAVEDASGTALVLAQARFWAAQRPERRPHRLVFVVQAGHMCGGTGLETYLRDHKDELDRIVLQVHLEHVALEAEDRGGQLIATDRCAPRWFFTSRIAALEAAVGTAIRAEGLARSLIVAPDALGESPPTDGGLYHRHGVPIVQFLAAPSYLFEPTDTLDKIDTASLVPLTRAAIRIIDATTGIGPADWRAR